jgi:hypothetical protein
MMNSDFCFFHDPEKAQDRAAARKAGGIMRARRAVVLPPDTPNFELGTLEQVHGLLGEMINHVLRGELDPKIASTVGYLVLIQLKVKQSLPDVPLLPALKGIRSEENRVQREPQRRLSGLTGGLGSHTGSRHLQTQAADLLPRSVNDTPEDNEQNE